MNADCSIHHGENWKHKKTGKMCIALNTPKGTWDLVRILHQSGRITSKRVNYFLYDYEKHEEKKC